MTKKILFSGLICVLLSFVLTASVSAIGQMTEPIVINDALRGQEIPQRVTLINSENQVVTFKVVGTGQIKDWVSFYEESDLSKALSEVQVSANYYHNVKAVFRIPNDTPNGTYTGMIDAIIAPNQDANSQSTSVNMKVSRAVTINVSDKEIVALDAFIVPVDNTVLAGKPAQIKVTYDNRGNVSLKPSLQLKVYGANNAVVFNAIFPYPDNIDAVKSLERKELPLIEWPTAGQDAGEYLTEVLVLIDGKEVKMEPITFRVTDSQLPGSMGGAMANLGSIPVQWLIVVVGLIVTVAALLFMLLIKKTKKA